MTIFTELAKLNEELEKFSKGLYQAKVDDRLVIGKQGTRDKQITTVKKIYPDGSVLDSGGNVFQKNGILKKAGHNLPGYANRKGITISATLMTQEEADELYVQSALEIISRNLKNIKSREQAEKMLDSLSDMLNIRFHTGYDSLSSRFTK